MKWDGGIFSVLLAFAHAHATAPCERVHPAGNLKAGTNLTESYDWSVLENDSCDIVPKEHVTDKVIHSKVDDDEYESEIINVEDADRARRPYLYKRDSVAGQYVMKRDFATKSVVIITIVLIIIGLMTTFMVCSRYRYNSEAAT
ncbi:fumarate hydratase, putative [Babesia ovata]|uniref:Fumarate hydratase, putative n=1 Tax=Babesia ovata TaxID=189622 RepID=A0A2H6KA20_9APIC|nr:fumarate hydratase, putative [Babesia ovata]GBE59841.1 fumarate hydratase, putative [Babesia ovata]